MKWYNAEKAYGFIVRKIGKDVFFHRSAIVNDGGSTLKEGDGVAFDVNEAPERIDGQERGQDVVMRLIHQRRRRR